MPARYRLQVTVLQPAHGGFDTWDWVEGFDLAGGPVIEASEAVCYEAYEDALTDAGVEFEQTGALTVSNERGRVYRIKGTLTESDRRNGLRDGDRDTYEMVWVEQDAGSETSA